MGCYGKTKSFRFYIVQLQNMANISRLASIVKSFRK